ncbi:hypothetical protein ACA910_011515 [Epithemia clementina (nom. ined.)]
MSHQRGQDQGLSPASPYALRQSISSSSPSVAALFPRTLSSFSAVDRDNTNEIQHTRAIQHRHRPGHDDNRRHYPHGNHHPDSPITTTMGNSSSSTSIPHMLSGRRCRAYTNDTIPTLDDGPAAEGEEEEEDYLFFLEEYYNTSSPSPHPPLLDPYDYPDPDEEYDNLHHPHVNECHSPYSSSSSFLLEPPTVCHDDGLMNPPSLYGGNSSQQSRATMATTTTASSSASISSLEQRLPSGPPLPIRVTAVSTLADRMNDMLLTEDGTSTAAATDHQEHYYDKSNNINKENIPPSLVNIVIETITLVDTPISTATAAASTDSTGFNSTLPPPPPPPSTPPAHHHHRRHHHHHHSGASSLGEAPPGPRKQHRRNRTQIVFCDTTSTTTTGGI